MAFAVSIPSRDPASILLLPPEIRNKIYLLAFTNLRLSIVVGPTEFEPQCAFRNGSRALLMTNKRIREETVAYLYHHLTIRTLWSFLPIHCALPTPNTRAAFSKPFGMPR